MRLAMIGVVSALLITSFGCATNAQKITADPNQGTKHEVLLPMTDARLQQKVSYKARHTALKVILADLSKTSGVVLRAGYNNDDWQVRDRKMNVFAKDVPLAALMNSIARVMRFKWSKRDDVDPPQYRLYLDRKTLLAANAAKSRAEKEFFEFAAKQRAAYYDYIVNCKEPTPSEMAALKDEQPYLYLLHDRGTVKLLRAFFKEIPGFTEAFLSGDRQLNPPVTVLSQETRQMLLSTVREKWRAQDMWTGDQASGGKTTPFPQSVVDGLDKARLRLEVLMPEELCQNDTNDFRLGRMKLLSDRLVLPIDQLMDPQNPVAEEASRQELAALESDAGWEQVQKDGESQLDGAFRKTFEARQKYFPCEPTTEHPDEPDLHKTVILKRADTRREDSGKPSQQFADLLESLADATGLSAVSDSFALMSMTADGGIYGSSRELNDVLDAVSEGFACNWEKHSCVLEFQDKYWFRKRTTQIPDEWVRKWWRNFKRNGFIVFDDLAQMAAITKEQKRESLLPNDDFPVPDKNKWPGGLSWTLEHGRHLFRFYRSLDPHQRALFLSNDGLDTQMLTMPQFELARNIFDAPEDPEWGAVSIWEGSNTPARLCARLRDFNEKEMRYVIIAIAADGSHRRERRVISPKYVEPSGANDGAQPSSANTPRPATAGPSK